MTRVAAVWGADVTTKDIAGGYRLQSEPPCSGRRSLPNLVQAWRSVCCGPVRWKYAVSDKLLPQSVLPV